MSLKSAHIRAGLAELSRRGIRGAHVEGGGKHLRLVWEGGYVVVSSSPRSKTGAVRSVLKEIDRRLAHRGTRHHEHHPQP